MVTKYVFAGLLACSTLTFAGELGYVNLSECVQKSEIGKKELENLESLKKQMSTLVADVEKQLTELSEKFNDTDYMDTLSPKAEEEMKGKYQALSEEHARYQQQFSQVMQQVGYRINQVVGGSAQAAAKEVAKKHGLKYVINREALLFADDSLDVTTEIITNMNESFAKEQQPSPAAKE